MESPADLTETPAEFLDEASLERRSGRQPAPLAPGLYVVATPIGNLEDITLRALRVLREADRIACEDTRQTQKLLHAFGLTTPTVSYHAHNESGRAHTLLEELQAGARVAIVSDAGTPAIADPGAILVRDAIDAGVPVFPVPGPNAAISALVASGLSTERFRFNGFLPSRPGERRSALEEMKAALRAGAPATTEIWYETPHRVLDALADVEAVFGAEQRVALARELTKRYEEMLRGTVADVRSALSARDSIRGEFVLLFEPTLEAAGGGQSLADRIRACMADGLSEKDALKQVARERNLGKSEVYREWQRAR